MSASLRRIAPIALISTLVFAGSWAAPRMAVPRAGGGGMGHGGFTAPRGGGVPRGGGHAVPHGGGGGMAHGVAPSHAGTRGMPPPHGQVPAHGTANGIARYGYGGYYYGGYPYYGYGYPCYGYPYYGYGYWGWPYWGFGFYGSWGYPYYGYYPDGGGGGYAPDEVHPQGPATIETKIDPGNAEVILDGESVGYAKDYNGHWDDLKTTPGKHTLSFRSGGYKTLTFDIDAMPGGRYVLDNSLTEGSGEEHRTIAAPQAPQRQQQPHAPTADQGYAPGGPSNGAPPVFQEKMNVAGGRMTI